MLNYADKVFEHFNFSSGIDITTQNKSVKQLYISGKIKMSTLMFFGAVVLVFTGSKLISRIKMVYWNFYSYCSNYNINY